MKKVIITLQTEDYLETGYRLVIENSIIVVEKFIPTKLSPTQSFPFPVWETSTDEVTHLISKTQKYDIEYHLWDQKPKKTNFTEDGIYVYRDGYEFYQKYYTSLIGELAGDGMSFAKIVQGEIIETFGF